MLLTDKEYLAMSEEQFDKYMCEKYPILFQQRNMPMTQTCMCWGFNINKGWYKLLDTLCQELDLIARLTGIQAVVIQVKEKFATLRFYHEHLNTGTKDLLQDDIDICCDIIDNCVNNAENKSGVTCENCGDWGAIRNRLPWKLTLCAKHYAEVLKEKNMKTDEEIDEEEENES